MKKGNKFFAKKITVNGETFDSKLEYERYNYLKSCQSKGMITDLNRQSVFVLIGNQYEIVSKQLKTKVKSVKRVAERQCVYKADFTYKVDNRNVVEDTKSKYTRTKDYIIKRKLMLFIHKIKVYEVTKPTQPIYIPTSIFCDDEEE